MRATWLRIRMAWSEREVTVWGSLGACELGCPPLRPSASRMETRTLTTPKNSERRMTRSTAAPSWASAPWPASGGGGGGGWYSLTRLPRKPVARRSSSGTGEAPSKSLMPRTSARLRRSLSFSESPHRRRWLTRRCFMPEAVSGSGCFMWRESTCRTCGRKSTATLWASGSGEVAQKWASRLASARSASGSTRFVSIRKTRTSGCLLMRPSHFSAPSSALLVCRQAGGRPRSAGPESRPMESLIREQISSTVFAQPSLSTRA
mmetsp:Transcript_67873/g.198614  ORF Transcript_67873/g.198614 Transcript_67873/m.198614 type:complete len:262 (+) Transcript_67873:583-1368(+)